MPLRYRLNQDFFVYMWGRQFAWCACWEVLFYRLNGLHRGCFIVRQMILMVHGVYEMRHWKFHKYLILLIFIIFMIACVPC
jgi:hypothetical protein